jgi:hypothetical protein
VLIFETATQTQTVQRVTLRNPIESPLRINWLTAKYEVGDALLDAPISELGFPAQIEAGGELTFSVIKPPLNSLAANTTLHNLSLLFNLAGVEVLPDREGVWNAILDPVIQADYRDEVTVKAGPGLFERHAIWAIEVEFPGRVSVELTPARTESNAQIFLPIRDFVLGQNSDASYQRRLRVAYQTHVAADTEWLPFAGKIIYITDAELPKGASDVAASHA